MSKLLKWLLDLQAMGYETVTIEEVIIKLRAFTPRRGRRVTR